ncbi:MAG: methyltransferase domain-containing protein [Desulfohalobiaceae bacterium]|nr:methyltransferase domain-containing protein [Desulfohalobiaceae bacterium]
MYDPVLNPLLDGMRRRVTEAILAEGLPRVLDLCCGTGRQCRLLHEHGVQTVGVDSSPAMLEQARRKSVPGIAYRLEDASETSFDESSFDGVLLSLALHEKHPAVRAAILRESERLVTWDGAIIIVDYIRPTSLQGWCARPVIRLVERLAGAEHARHQKQYMAAGELEGLGLEQAGWRRQRMWPVCLGTMAIAVFRRAGKHDEQRSGRG